MTKIDYEDSKIEQQRSTINEQSETDISTRYRHDY